MVLTAPEVPDSEVSVVVVAVIVAVAVLDQESMEGESLLACRKLHHLEQ